MGVEGRVRVKSGMVIADDGLLGMIQLVSLNDELSD